MSPDLQSLLDRRLIVVSGKGGTGKTTVVASLALAAVSRGLRVAVIETGRNAHLPSLLGHPGPEPPYPGAEIRPGLWGLRMQPYDALVEYLQSQLHIPGLVTRLLNQPAFHALLDAAPGWRELITMGKVWHLEQAQNDKGQREWDLLLIDSPATGHGLSLLDVPRVVVSAVRTGPLHRHVGWVEELVKDPSRCLLLPVTLPEELPVRETLELVQQARDDVGIAVDRVVVNRCIEAPGLTEPEAAAQRLERWADDPEAGAASTACSHALRIQTLRGEQHGRACRELEDALDLPLVRLPTLREAAEGEAQLIPLGERLLSGGLDR